MLDNNTPQWFSANSAGPGMFGAACTLTGASNEKHTITVSYTRRLERPELDLKVFCPKVANGDQPGWWLSISNITLSTNPAQGDITFT